MVISLKSSFVKEKENETSLGDFFYTLESPSNPMTFISNYLMNVIASIVEKNY